MRFNVDEITALIQKEIREYEPVLHDEEVGLVVDVGDGIARVSGLHKVMSGELVRFENDIAGLCLNLEENIVGVVIFGDYLQVRAGQTVKRTKHLLKVPVGDELIGRVVNPLGEPLDGKGPVRTTRTRPIEMIAPGIAYRQPVNTPLQTGIKAIDSMIPIGKGQRELIIGDRQTGKTTVAIDSIINQKGSGVVCIYVAIGQKNSTVAGLVARLREHGAMEHTIVVVAGASDPAPMLYIAPYAGCAMGEYFTYEKQRDVLCVYDDLTKHANAYRQLSLLLRRPPGREAFPGDVFYLHSRLLERAVRLDKKRGGGSLTALPIIETQEGEVAAYISTNVISITDGQIYLTPKLFALGVRPAIDVGMSVSRVGGNAQTKAMKKVAGRLRLNMAQFRSLEAFSQVGTDLDKNTQRQLAKGYTLVEVLKQPQYSPCPVEEQALILYVATNDYLEGIPTSKVQTFERQFIEWIKSHKPHILSNIKDTNNIEGEADIQASIEEYVKLFRQIHDI